MTIDPVPAHATWNSPDFSTDMAKFFTDRFGAARVAEVPPAMAGEDFGEIARSDPDHVKSLIFWVGGRPADVIENARKEGKMLPGLHSPFWAPEADKVIAAGAEALSSAAMTLMPRRQVTEN